MAAVESIIVSFWSVLGDMSLYLLFGFLVAGLMSVLISPQTVERHLGGKGLWPIVKAGAFGVPLPLCSCGVIPVTVSLHKHGASKSAALSFLLSTPQTGVDSIAVTYSLLGPVFAVLRPMAAFITGIVGGIAAGIFDRTGSKNNKPCQDECCATDKEKKPPAIVRMLKHGFVVLPRDVGPSMLAGLLIAGLITAIIPENFFADKLGTGLWAKIAMLLIGIPMYVCSTASVPIAAAMVLHGGLTPGAAMVFLMTGPATNAASYIVIWKSLGGRAAIIYMTTVIVIALLFGILTDAFGLTISRETAGHVHNTTAGWIKNYAAIVLLAILIWGSILKYRR